MEEIVKSTKNSKGRFLFLLALSPLLFMTFFFAFTFVILVYSLLFCFLVFSLCLGIIAVLYGLHFFISLFNYFPYALFEVGISLFCFGMTSILFRELNFLILFSNKVVKKGYHSFKKCIKGENYA